MRRLFLVLAGVAVMAVCSAAPQLSEKEKEAHKFADKLIKKMTLREKIGQLEQFITRKGVVTGPGGVKCDIDSAVRKGEVGSFLSIRNRDEALRLQKMAVEESRMGIPLIFGYDIIHGCKIIFPENLAMASSWNIEAIERSARIAAEESAASAAKRLARCGASSSVNIKSPRLTGIPFLNDERSRNPEIRGCIVAE